jgi:tRNA A-37 threonylcarbamoyl transferase component Bud32
VEAARVEPGFEQRVDEHGSVSAHTLAALLDAEPAEYLRRAGARETFVHVSTPGAPPWVVKRARERDLGAFVGIGRRPLGEREHANLARLAADGLPVPRALGWTARRSGAAVCSLVVMELVEHAETLRERLAAADPRERARWSERLVALVTALHVRGWYHRDLYLQHFVVRSGADRSGELALLDVARAEQELAPRERWFVKDLAALLHSTPRVVGARERLRFVARYLDARGIGGRAARRAFVARVARKERRIAAHVPKSGEERPWTDR